MFIIILNARSPEQENNLKKTEKCNCHIICKIFIIIHRV